MQNTTNTFIKEKRKYISHLAAAGMDDKTSRFSVSVVGTEKPKPGPCVFKNVPSSEHYIPKDQWDKPLAAVRSALTEFEVDKVRLLWELLFLGNWSFLINRQTWLTVCAPTSMTRSKRPASMWAILNILILKFSSSLPHHTFEAYQQVVHPQALFAL